ncbi:hypothetical protein [Cohnella sp. JJ-181]|uniref:hypothetical protein n=1 Tax=Cohnella rhizoplanae TaxID=2974897 RepID=UPI0022FF9378|nr:hypothetical protein [Cohnella sp. JJ-181]CAI6082123.1 hypothetical protein COHCIP112018_03537 [Cohnella sp. JJ-181]
MTKASDSSSEHSYLFSVEIMVRGNTSGEALEKLLKPLNEAGYADFRIQSGISLGETIQKELKEAKTKHQVLTESLDARIRNYIKTSRLIRLTVNRAKGDKLSVPCRVVNFDPDNELLTVYHVDEKSVYSFRLNEIDDFAE